MNGIESLLRRGRAITATALVIIVAVAWTYVLQLAAGMEMGGMDMAGFRMVSTGFSMAMVPARAPWNLAEFALTFIMWTVMMVGMMTPSAAPMILIHARVGRMAASAGAALAATGWFVAAYVATWAGFALVATLAQWALQRSALLDPTMASASEVLGGSILIAAGLYQWTPLKHACLSTCQSPLSFIERHGGFQAGLAAAFRLGGEHGLYCVGCCWALMALLFAGGIMNIAWIAALTVFALAEKIIPGRWLSWMSGAVLVAWGVLLLV